MLDEDSFFDLLSRAQSKRMDDQRCDPKALQENKENRPRVRATDAPRSNNFSFFLLFVFFSPKFAYFFFIYLFYSATRAFRFFPVAWIFCFFVFLYFFLDRFVSFE